MRPKVNNKAIILKKNDPGLYSTFLNINFELIILILSRNGSDYIYIGKRQWKINSFFLNSYI